VRERSKNKNSKIAGNNVMVVVFMFWLGCRGAAYVRRAACQRCKSSLCGRLKVILRLFVAV
jgi:hypothetical protein